MVGFDVRGQQTDFPEDPILEPLVDIDRGRVDLRVAWTQAEAALGRRLGGFSHGRMILRREGNSIAGELALGARRLRGLAGSTWTGASAS